MQTIGGSYHDMAPYYSPSFASDAQIHKFTNSNSKSKRKRKSGNKVFSSTWILINVITVAFFPPIWGIHSLL